MGPAGLRQWPSVELHLLFLKIVHEQLCWLLLGSHMSPCAGPLPGLCSVCKYLQGQARDNLQQSVTPGQARPPEPELSPGQSAQGPELMLVMTLRSDCVQVTRISVQVSLAGSLYFPALPQIITDSGSVTCCVRPGLAWPGECAGTRSVTESEMK